jgi:hypothetical protein
MVKRMFGVEYYSALEDASTYEIFPTLQEAKSFCDDQTLWTEHYFPLYIFEAQFNSNRIYREPDLGCWNYEDNHDTILKYGRIFIEINAKPC